MIDLSNPADLVPTREMIDIRFPYEAYKNFIANNFRPEQLTHEANEWLKIHHDAVMVVFDRYRWSIDYLPDFEIYLKFLYGVVVLNYYEEYGMTRDIDGYTADWLHLWDGIDDSVRREYNH